MNIIVETNALISSLHWYATTATGPFMIWRRSIYYYSMLFVVYNAYIHTHTWFFISNELFPQTYIICSAPANLLHGIWNNWSHIDREPLPSGFFSVRTWPDDIIKLLACFYCLYISFCNHIMHAVLPAIRIKIDRVLRLPCMNQLLSSYYYVSYISMLTGRGIDRAHWFHALHYVYLSLHCSSFRSMMTVNAN